MLALFPTHPGAVPRAVADPAIGTSGGLDAKKRTPPNARSRTLPNGWGVDWGTTQLVRRGTTQPNFFQTRETVSCHNHLHFAVLTSPNCPLCPDVSASVFFFVKRLHSFAWKLHKSRLLLLLGRGHGIHQLLQSLPGVDGCRSWCRRVTYVKRFVFEGILMTDAL